VKTQSRIALFIFSLLVWLGLTWPVTVPELLAGVLVAGLVAVLTGDMFVGRPHQLAEVRRYAWFGVYLPLFLWECLKASLDLAWRTIHPKLPIRPGIVRIKTGLVSDTGLTFLANTLTLARPVLTVDVDREAGVLYVHWVAVPGEGMEEATRAVVGRFESVLKRIFE
jgi:multicomponent Na+:H+ antiporter subunit E